jgi:SAM-dependent methyltransferase
MRRPEFIARQSRCPSGLLGKLILRIMAGETAPENAVALDLLDLRASDSALDIGFGHGRSLAELARRCGGLVAGVDISPNAVATALRGFRALVERGSMEVRRADGETLPFADGRFDKALSIHTLYFWKNPERCLTEIARVIKPGGRFVLGFRPRSDTRAVADLPASVYTFYDPPEVAALLDRAGFVDVEMIVGARHRSVLLARATRA